MFIIHLQKLNCDKRGNDLLRQGKQFVAIKEKRGKAFKSERKKFLSTAKGIRDYANENHIKVIVEECDDGFECLYKIYTGFSENHKYKCIITDDSMKFLNGTFMAYIIQILIEDKVI